MTSGFKTILIATDFGPESDVALRTGAVLARQLSASTHLLHVVRDPVVALATPELYGIDWQALRDDIISDAQKRLAALASSLTGSRVTMEAAVGSPAETIAQRAKELGADVIVMGTHGRGGVGHLFIGSVAERVIRLASCPVMTVRASGAVHIETHDGSAAEHASEAHAAR